MQFSAVHGTNVVIEDNGRRAARKNEFTFANGLVFLEGPLPINTPLSLKVKSSDIKWHGALSIGLTDRSPADIHKEKLPKLLQQLCDEDHYRFRMSPQSWSDCRLILLLSSNYDLVVTVNDDQPFVFLSKFPVTCDAQLFLILDLFGRTTSITLTAFDERKRRIPTDIAVLGPSLVQSFSAACKEAAVPQNHGRVCFIGPYAAGKTALIRALLGIA